MPGTFISFILISAIGILGFLAALKFSKYNRPDTSVVIRNNALFLGQIFLDGSNFSILFINQF